MNSNNIIAITGPTASGKSDLALELAQKLNSVILSADSLAVYKEIDIASAKPNPKELAQIRHFGVNELYPNNKFSVIEFLNYFQEASNWAKTHNKGLIIVGGTSFYLKVLSQGISNLPNPSGEILKNVANIMQDLKRAYKMLQKIDLTYSKSIASSDRYRIEKALIIYKTTNIAPSIYFKDNPQKPIVPNLNIYEIAIPRDVLRQRVVKRVKKMLNMGLIDEVAYLEHKYTRESQAMCAIGIKEVLDYFDGRYNKKELLEKISTNTIRLAKRQVTFNKSQLNIKFSLDAKKIATLF